MKAFLVDVFYSRIQGRDAVTGAGRLENGETFGFIDYRLESILYIRKSDELEVRKLLPKAFFVLSPSPKKTMDGEGVLSLRAPNLGDLRAINSSLRDKNIRTYEGDLDFAKRFRVTRDIKLTVDIEGEVQTSNFVDRLYINPTMIPADAEIPLRVLAIDIETNADASELLGFSFVSWTLGDREKQSEEVHLHGPAKADDPSFLSAHASEKDLMIAFQNRLMAIDPDIVTGWNVIDFDLSVLQKIAAKHHIPFSLGRTKGQSQYKKSKYFGGSRVSIQGRQVLDALMLARHTLFNFDDLRLGTVAKALLGRGKTLLVEEWEDAASAIHEAYVNDRKAFADYVLEDSRLVKDILDKQSLLELTIARSKLTSLSLERAWGSIAAFEALYIAELHRRNIAAPTLGVDMKIETMGTGGLVLSPKVGLHEHVLIFDFKSLYPSIMRTFNIDPLTYVQGHLLSSEKVIEAPNGAKFSREPGILPAMLETFTERREEAKKQADALRSYTYKIIMNSFYGVLATDSCRFADMEMADAITGFGQMLLAQMRDYFESLGHEVLYGDTDSLFVKVSELKGQEATKAWSFGQEACAAANEFLRSKIRREFQLESKMELEFEKYFRFCFLPPDRQGDSGRAKNYAGLSIKDGEEELVITGLEAIRSDWTRFAKDLQRELLSMMFHEERPELISRHIRGKLKGLLKGEWDADLVYRKRIRRPLESYTKTTPPHIRAARLLPRPVKVVRYIMTDLGAEPLGFVRGRIDYEHYIEKQIRPIVENIARYAGFEAEDALDKAAGLQFSGSFT